MPCAGDWWKQKGSLGRYSLRARYILPVGSQPIECGVVTVDGGRIVAVGQLAPAGNHTCDLGEVALLPGLINAHTHLDLSHFERPLGQPGIRLVDWIPALMAWRVEQAAPPSKAVAHGLRECLDLGSTTLAEIASPGWPRPELELYRIRTLLLQELIGPTASRVGPAMELARRHLESQCGPVWQLGLSPHAPYTVRPELLDAAIDLAVAAGAPVAMHVAESLEEIELLATGEGPMRDMLENLGAWSPGLVPAPLRPIDYLRKLAAAPRALVIHGNYLDANEWGYLATRRERMSVVYCPRSHSHFGHAGYPLEKMLEAGVNVCLGTDSRASAPNLSVLAEMRFAADQHPDVPPAKIVEMGTLAAARAMGSEAELGSLEPGKQADFTAVALSPEPGSADPYENLLRGNGQAVASWARGAKLYPQP